MPKAAAMSHQGMSSSLEDIKVEHLDETDEMATASLFEVLSSRNELLGEEELWALCRECCLTLEYVHDSHDLFQSLCISPDTVAFDPEGNVCFLDLEMEAETPYVAPECAENGEQTYKSHLYSLGMTLLFATEYNSGSEDSSVTLSNSFRELLTSLTSDDSRQRPDLDMVIDACEKALNGKSSQEICLNIISQEEHASQETSGHGRSSTRSEDSESGGGQQTALVQNEVLSNKDFDHSSLEHPTDCDSQEISLTASLKGDTSARCSILRDASYDEEDVVTEDQEANTTPRRWRKQQGILLCDMLNSLDRHLDEQEIWSLCRESLLSLQRKKKHLPAYISFDTLMIRDSGTVSFKAIPDDKPLEVVYMAPELQQKGILSDKTCIYGLGVTLRSCAGVMHPSTISVADGNSLGILIQSFTQGNPEKRPNLDTALKMCEEFKKASETRSREICQTIYQQALERTATSKSAHLSTQIIEESDVDKKNKYQDTTIGRQNILYDADQDDTVTPGTGPRQASLETTMDDKTVLTSLSAFKPVAVRPKPLTDSYRMPSAFSSPATHFKPIVLNQTNPESNNLQSSNVEDNSLTAGKTSDEKDIATKLRNIKYSLLQHKNLGPVGTGLKQSKEEAALTVSNDNNKSAGNEPSIRSADSVSQHSQPQDQLASTDVLASAIAHYLHRHLSGSTQDNSNVHSFQTSHGQAGGFSGANTVVSTMGGSTQSFNALPPQSVASYPLPSYMSVPLSNNGYQSILQCNPKTVSSSATSVTVSANKVPYSLPGNNASLPINMSASEHAHSSFTSTQNSLPIITPSGPSRVPVQNALPVSLPASGPYSSSSPVIASSSLPVQFTLIQDPVTGLLQMVPMSYVPLSQTHLMPNYLPSGSVNTEQHLLRPDQAHQVPSPKRQDKSPSKESSPWHDHINTKHDSNLDNISTPPSSDNLVVKQSQGFVNHTQVSNNQHGVREERNYRSSSPSPSKDSGICLTHQSGTAPDSRETPMERQITTENSQRQATLSQVIQIVQEEFPGEDVMDSGVESLALAEYILSLSSLTWETFCNAVTEKYFHLIWRSDFLDNLYRTIGRQKSPDSECAAYTRTKNRRSYLLHHAIDEAGDTGKYQEAKSDVGSRLYKQKEFQRYDCSQAISSPGDKSSNRQPGGLQSPFRSRSELGRHKGIWSETSDSTDSEPKDEKLRFKKRGELGKTKSSSTHNIVAESNSLTPEQNNNIAKGKAGFFDQSNASVSKSSSSTNSSLAAVFNQNRTSVSSGSKQITGSLPCDVNPIKASSTWSNTEAGSDFTPLNPFTDRQKCLSSPSARVTSHFSSESRSSQNNTLLANINQSESKSSYRQNAQHRAEHLNRLSNQAPPLKPAYAQSSPYSSSSGPFSTNCSGIAVSPKGQHLRPKTAQQQFQVAESFRHSLTETSPLPSYPGVNSDTFDASKHLSPGKCRPGSELRGKHWDNEASAEYPKMQEFNQYSLHDKKLQQGVNYQDKSHNNFTDSDVSSSQEMRRLAAEKPELYKERHKSGFSMPPDNQMKMKSETSIASLNLSTVPTAIAPNLRPAFSNETSTHNGTLKNHRRSQSSDHGVLGSNSRNDGATGVWSPKTHSFSDSDSSSAVGFNPSSSWSGVQGEILTSGSSRSHYAANAWQPVQREYGVRDKTTLSNAMKGRGGTLQQIEVKIENRPHFKRGHVVYHSAMIQLNLTTDMDTFIHSIDEENELAIESRLSSITQEITVQQRQRKKTQKFFRKLADQRNEAKNSKGDQIVSDQVLRDIAEMTRKLTFLHMCKTHLQMLLAELHGLDSCFLYTMSANEGCPTLILQACEENPYLQFRTIRAPQAGQMSVLQAGTPRGLLAYLYTSSALSEGYIHQFLFCFRYFLTSDQLLTFVVDKFRAAQRSNPNDVNMVRVQRRSLDLLYFWVEGYYSVDFAPNKKLTERLEDFLKEQTDAGMDEASNLSHLCAACRLGENLELMLATELDEDDEWDSAYFTRLTSPKRQSFKSVLKRSKSEKSIDGSSGTSGKSVSGFKNMPYGGGRESSHELSVMDCSAHTLTEQLTLMEQSLFRQCHPVQFLNSQSQGVGVALSIPGQRTPSMQRKSDAGQTAARGLFVGDPLIESTALQMIAHSHELAHWVSAEILSCGSNKTQVNIITKFLTIAHMCLEIRNYASALSILDGLENVVVRQLPVWKNITAKTATCLDELTAVKMKLKSEAQWLMSEKDWQIYPTIPCVLYAMLHIQQVEIGSFTLANGMLKWDKMRSVTELVDQLRIFRDHEYGYEPDASIQTWIRRHLSEFKEQDLHAIASTQDNNFRRRHSSSTSLTGTLKKVKDKLQPKKK